jgi:hypothetical protein
MRLSASLAGILIRAAWFAATQQGSNPLAAPSAGGRRQKVIAKEHNASGGFRPSSPRVACKPANGQRTWEPPEASLPKATNFKSGRRLQLHD